MAYDKDKTAEWLAAEFERIATESPGVKATHIVAGAVAEAIDRALKSVDVEVPIQITQEVAAVPATIVIDKTVKGVLK